MITHWESIVVALVTGGALVKIAEFGIAWAKEKREQRSGKTVHEKDRPRFRIDVAIVPASHGYILAAVVKILSLGGLPLTINHGEAFIEASHYPERIEPKKLDNREISSIAPIELKFTLPLKLINPMSGGKPLVKLVCQFSYGEDNTKYRQEWIYNRSNGEFELHD
jgi:hypothetical protein